MRATISFYQKRCAEEIRKGTEVVIYAPFLFGVLICGVDYATRLALLNSVEWQSYTSSHYLPLITRNEIISRVKEIWKVDVVDLDK